MKTARLQYFYDKYNIANLKFGEIHDKLGDAYEEYVCSILNDVDIFANIKAGNFDNNIDISIMKSILSSANIDIQSINSISATTNIPLRDTGGLSKTDIILYVNYTDNTTDIIPISCKQSYAPKVALAEFDVDTICREMKSDNTRLYELLLKHQVDCSAKNFTAREKEELKELMQPIARNFVRWVLTGSPTEDANNVCIPTLYIKFKTKKPADRYNINVLNGDLDFLSFNTYSMEEYIDGIMLDKKGNIKSGGFGTGLGWTYATGSKGKKMQFKG